MQKLKATQEIFCDSMLKSEVIFKISMSIRHLQMPRMECRESNGAHGTHTALPRLVTGLLLRQLCIPQALGHSVIRSAAGRSAQISTATNSEVYSNPAHNSYCKNQHTVSQTGPTRERWECCVRLIAHTRQRLGDERRVVGEILGPSGIH